ncbi:MAG: Stk1 family PASTA domain-containing Ser/Thr kinase [Candidatus Faecousia sp.]|nr:Stk1 family PASTA domain-containing Ser/Thr kinase [Candidatus Faecousia sp.]
MDQYIGRLLDGRYEILEVIGTGGMAVVYKARCHRLNRLVAIKILKDEFARDEEFRRRFRAEGEAVAMLSHPNIVQVYDVSTSDSANFIVMELIDGISLKEYMEKKGVLNWKETLHFSLQIAKGLEHAHSRGIIHRDIKPHNIMVLKNGSVKVMDFGIARVMNKSNTLTKEALGSVHYISPEQAKGGHTDNRSDLYSLGVVMYEMMAGRPPYDGESAVSVAIQHINGGAPAPSVYNPNIPKGLEQIIMKAMALEVRDRYVSATEMLQDMEEFRKNPAIVFDYHTLLDDATRKIPTAGIPMTTAEKKVQARTGERPASQPAPQRRTGTAARPVTAQRDSEIVSRVQQRHREEQKKKEKERSRVATTAIVICSAVAVFAIIVFLIALFSGALLDQEKDTVEVPYLTGGLYSEALAEDYPDFAIRLQPRQYSESHPKDEIISQEPVGGSKVQRGSAIWITVSMGPEPEVRTLDNFAGADAEEAYKLLDSQGFKPLKKKEVSYVYEAGVVTRTDPGAGSEVTEGQTIYIYVSTGPEVVEKSMPNVVGLELNRARELMNQLGFTNVRFEPTESSQPENEVVYQSVTKNETVDVTAEVIIQYSRGATETAGDTQPQETEPDTTTRTFDVSWVVPVRDEEYQLDVCLAGTPEVLVQRMVSPGAQTVVLKLTGSGVVYYDLYINGDFVETKSVDFTPKKVEP